MKAPYYTVKAELKKFWFNPSKIVYVLEEHREAWYDPSCGAGAGGTDLTQRLLTRAKTGCLFKTSATH